MLVVAGPIIPVVGQAEPVLHKLGPAAPLMQQQALPAGGQQPQQQPPAAAPADPAQPGPVVPQEIERFLELLMQNRMQAQAAPTAQQLEQLYHAVWERVGATYHDHEALKDWAQWENKYAGKLTTIEECEAAIKEMVSSLNDRWTKYTTSAEIAASRTQHQAGMEHLGMALARQPDGSYKLDFLMYGSPAQRSDLRKGDTVKSIGGKDLAGLDQKDADALLLQKAGTKVEIVYAHDGVEEKLTLTSAATPDPTVEARLLPGKIAYIRLPSFEDEAVVGEFANQLAALHKQAGGKFEGLVLDLRGNPGGQFQLAIMVSSLFVEKGTVVSSTTRNGRLVTHTRFETVKPFAQDFSGAEPALIALMKDLYTVPMSVITDGSTASAAEIVTGALKDNDRARIVGQTTYGKGVGYQTGRLPTGGVLSITSLDYLTPSGYNLANKGIVPHTVVVQLRGSLIDTQLSVALDEIKQQQKNSNPAKPQGAAASSQQLDAGSVLLRAALISLVLLGLFLYGMHMHLQAKREEEKRKGNGQ